MNKAGTASTSGAHGEATSTRTDSQHAPMASSTPAVQLQAVVPALDSAPTSGTASVASPSSAQNAQRAKPERARRKHPKQNELSVEEQEHRRALWRAAGKRRDLKKERERKRKSWRKLHGKGLRYYYPDPESGDGGAPSYHAGDQPRADESNGAAVRLWVGYTSPTGTTDGRADLGARASAPRSPDHLSAEATKQMALAYARQINAIAEHVIAMLSD